MSTSFIEIAKFLEEHNGAISAISTVFVAAFTYTLWRATTKLWHSSLKHSQHLESSLAEASRSASAMESVAKSLETTSAINREIADRQEVVTELQSRAYLSIVFIGVVTMGILPLMMCPFESTRMFAPYPSRQTFPSHYLTPRQLGALVLLVLNRIR
jgi:hypothetical protein